MDAWRRSGFYLLGLLPLAEAHGEPNWEVQMYRDRPYLTVEAIQRNYGFTEINSDPERFEMKSASAVLQGRVGAASITLNRLRYQLHFESASNGKYRLLSAYDLSNLVDLLLRPVDHLQARELKTVYLQAVGGGEASAKPVAAEIVLALQAALGGFGVKVRVIAEDAAGGAGESLRKEDAGATAWLRFKANPKLPGQYVRCGILAPPESPKREGGPGNSSGHTMYLGNLHDAESIALATLLQSGLVFGPGSKAQPVTDGGIAQDVTDPFQRSSGAAVLVEWGEAFAAEHLLKSIVAGVVRYQGFLKGMAEHQGQSAPALGAQVVIGGVDLKMQNGPPALAIQISGQNGDTIPGDIDLKDLEVQFFLFGGTAQGGIGLLATPPPKIGATSPEMWTQETGGKVELRYPLPAGIGEKARGPEFGFAVRLLWQGKIQDTFATPRGLQGQLWRFSSL